LPHFSFIHHMVLAFSSAQWDLDVNTILETNKIAHTYSISERSRSRTVYVHSGRKQKKFYPRRYEKGPHHINVESITQNAQSETDLDPVI